MKQDDIQRFIERTRKLSHHGGGLASGIAGTSNKQSLMMELQRVASLLPQAYAENKLAKQVEEVVGVLHVAQAMNVLGVDDLEELMVLLEKIEE